MKHYLWLLLVICTVSFAHGGGHGDGHGGHPGYNPGYHPHEHPGHGPSFNPGIIIVEPTPYCPNGYYYDPFGNIICE